MAQAVVKFKTSELINTFSCQDTSNLILCVNPDKVLQPEGFIGTKTYIIATILSGPTRCSTPSLPDCCTPRCPQYYTYEFVFDDDQLNPGEILNQCDIYNVVWDQCLIEWLNEIIAQESPNTATDTFSIDITLSGDLDRNIQADIIVSPFTDNVFEILTNGAFVKEMQTGVGLTNTVGPGTTQTLSLSLPQPPTGRLSLLSLTPVTQADIAGATDLYYTYYNGGVIWLYTAAVWTPYVFTQLAPLALGTLVNDSNYDVFIVDDSAGTPILELSAAWTNDTTRSQPLTVVDGFLVKQGAEGRLYIGTIRTTSTTTTDDTVAKRYVWNYYNQVRRTLLKKEATASWTYNSATYRPANNDPNNRVSVIVGAMNSVIDLTIHQQTDLPQNAFSTIDFGIDSVTTNSILPTSAPIFNSNVAIATIPGVVRLCTWVPVGYHFYQWLESAIAGTVTYYGNNDAGIVGFING